MNKIILFPIILILSISYTIFGQEESYGESRPGSFTIIGNNVPINKIPPSAYIKQYVEQNISNWQKKGEFEKIADYQIRVNDQTRNSKVQELTNEALKELKNEYAKTYLKECLLSQYDADNETYLIKSSEMGNIALQIPVADAQSFRENWSSMQLINTDFYINSNKMVLAKATFKNPANGKSYVYDSKQSTTYTANNITYNFTPIQVELKQDNIVQNNSKIENKTTTIGVADVDINIPVNSQINDKTFVVVIANENYTREVKVQFAVNDGKTFREYCEKTLGVPNKNIHFSQDATFGTMRSEIKWISDVTAAYNGKAKVIFYYAGHGMPNEADKSAYLLPTDGFSTDFETAIKLDELYNRLTANPAQSVTVILDACFSGSIRDNGMLANARGVRISPESNMLSGNMVVLSAATGNETAYPYKEKQHGLFTYYLLKKLQETKGDINLMELSNYVIENVKQQSIVVNQKSQTPQVNASLNLKEPWKTLKLNE